MMSIRLITRRLFSSASYTDLATQMKSFNESKQYRKTLQLFNENIVKKQVSCSRSTMFHVLKACTQLKDPKLSSNIHQMISNKFNNDPYLLSSLIHLYMQCGDVIRAESIFNSSRNKTNGICGAMMKGYLKNHEPKKTMDIFQQTKNPDAVIYILLFNACARLPSKETLTLIRNVSKNIPQSFYSNSNLVTSLIDAYGKCGDITSTQALFDSSEIKTIEMHNALMKGYIKNEQPTKVLMAFERIKNPDSVSYTMLYNACAQMQSKEGLELIRNVSKTIPKSFYSDVKLVTSLLDAYGKCGDVTSAQILFDSSENKNIEMHNALMKGYIKNEQPTKVLMTFEQIKNPDSVSYIMLYNACAQMQSKEGLELIRNVSKTIPKSFYSDVKLVTSLLDAYGKCGDITSAQALFGSLEIRTIEMYNALMKGYIIDDEPIKAVEVFQQRKDPNVISYMLLCNACAQLGHRSLSESTYKQIPTNLLLNEKIQTCLIDMWGKSGCVERAKEIYEQMSKPTQYAYNAMINAYGLNGLGSEAIELYLRLSLEHIDEVTHICILNACSHSGLITEARSIFDRIQMKTDRIIAVMVDCLSRAALLEEAQQLIQQYEQDHSPSFVMYMALLSGARNQKNSVLGQQVYDRMSELFPQSKDLFTSAATLLANIYASTGDSDKSFDIREQMRRSGHKKKSGLSWTYAKGQVNSFRAHDDSHPESRKIHAEMDKISKELDERGYQYDATWITRPLAEHETVASVLCGHSERLAIAYNFVVDPNVKEIQITKNLRVCGDCHRAIKLIAAIRQCDIIVRDANRFHHFKKNGQCSCNDYF